MAARRFRRIRNGERNVIGRDLRTFDRSIEHPANGVLGARDILLQAGKQQAVSIGTHSHVETLLERREVLIELSEEADVVGEVG